MDGQDHPANAAFNPFGLSIVFESRQTVMSGMKHLALLRAGLARANDTMQRAQTLIADAQQLLAPADRI